MAQKTGTRSILVNSVSRIRYIADRKELVDKAIEELEAEGKSVKNIVDGPIQPLGPLGNVFSTVDIIWELKEPAGNSAAPVYNTNPSIRVNDNNLDASLMRASLFLEDNDWDAARAYYNAILDIDPTFNKAYIGLYLSDNKISSEDEFSVWLSQYKVDPEDKNIKKAIRFGYDKYDLKEYASKYPAVQAVREEAARKDQILQDVEEQITRPYAIITTYKDAIVKLEEISGWRNADELLRTCQDKISEINAAAEAAKVAEEAAKAAEQEEIERQIAEKKKAAEVSIKRLKKCLAIIVPIVIVCVAIIVVITTIIIPKKKYNAAVEKYGQNYVDTICALNVGDSFSFGSYEQDVNIGNGKEAIEWVVLEKEKNQLLLISKKVIDVVPYVHSSIIRNYEAYDESLLREWLNNQFISDAFDEDEQSLVKENKIVVSKGRRTNIMGSDTYDKVFILSIEEANKYFKSNEDRICFATPYAKFRESMCLSNNLNKIKDDGSSPWLLRTPGEYDINNDATYCYFHMSAVFENGEISDYGCTILHRVEKKNKNFLEIFGVPIRPAIWISLY